MGTARLTELVGLGMPQLRQLVLRGNGLETVAELAAACKALSLLQTLDLSRNRLADLSCFTSNQHPTPRLGKRRR
jgi:Leucine-rich repeat (LRR) protein